MHKLSKVKSFIEMFGKKDAKVAKHTKCDKLLAELHKDLSKHIRALHKAIDPEKL